METWLSVVGYEGLYEVSNTGKIRTVARVYYSGKPTRKMILPQKAMQAKSDKDGYLNLALRKNKERKFLRVHRLVCQAFHPNPENKPFVNHKNGDKTCNHDWNLEWATASENELHSFRVLGKKPILSQLGKVGRLSKSSKPLYQYDLNGNLIKVWESARLAIASGFDKKGVYQVINGVFKQHRGFVWKR